MTQEQDINQDNIVAFISSELETLLGEMPSLGAETDMTTDITVDSVAIMDLVFALEEKFDISIPLNALADIRKIGQLADLVEKIHNERQNRG